MCIFRSSEAAIFRGWFAFKLRSSPPVMFTSFVIILQAVIITALLFKIISLENAKFAQYQNNTTLEELEEQQEKWPISKYAETIRAQVHFSIPGDQTRIFFNRVPKCGSSAVVDLAEEMSKLNNFSFARSSVYMTFHLSEQEQKVLSQRFLLAPTPLFYERHLHFLSVARFSATANPMYINIIRDPLDRLVSWYYFRRYQVGHRRKMPVSKRTRSYDQCVLGNYSECVEPLGNEAEEGYFKIIPFFCGQEDFCRVPSEKSLLQAIANVKRYYAVVGVVEMFDEYLEALEYVLPAYFTGVTHAYKKHGKKYYLRHSTKYKLPVSHEAAVIMAPKLQYEYQFYNFIRKRLSKLSAKIALVKNVKLVQNFGR